MLPRGYKTRKAAQVAAFFAIKAGGVISLLKLVKLLYLADREHLAKYDLPILFDCFVSMPHGPVVSMTYNFINGTGPEQEQQDWDSFIKARSGYNIGIQKHVKDEDLDELNRSERKTLESVWQEFGYKEKFELRDWTHDNCGEWEDPHGSSMPIPYERVLKFLGKKNPELIVKEIEDIRAMDFAMEPLR